jgi:hypothetical protein
MELIETLRNIAVREGFDAGRSLSEISKETGLSLDEVLSREIDLQLIPADGEAIDLHHIRAPRKAIAFASSRRT